MSSARITVATDGSAAAGRALDWAVDYATQHGASIEVLTVLDLGHLYAFEGLGVPELPIRAWQDELKRRVLDGALERMVDAQVPSRGKVLHGPVVLTLLRHLEENPAQLLVLGRSGKGALDAALGGSVARAMSRRADCPVVIVP